MRKASFKAAALRADKPRGVHSEVLGLRDRRVGSCAPKASGGLLPALGGLSGAPSGASASRGKGARQRRRRLVARSLRGTPAQSAGMVDFPVDALSKCMSPQPDNPEELEGWWHAWGALTGFWASRLEHARKIQQEQQARTERIAEERRLKLEKERLARSADGPRVDVAPGIPVVGAKGLGGFLLQANPAGGYPTVGLLAGRPVGGHPGGHAAFSPSPATLPSVTAMHQGKPKPPEALRHEDPERPILHGTKIGAARAPIVFLEAGCPEVCTYLRYDPQGPFAGGILEWMYSAHWDWSEWGFAEDGEKVYKADWFAVPSSKDEADIFVPRLATIKKMRRAPPRVEAFAEAFRAVNREVWAIIHDSLKELSSSFDTTIATIITTIIITTTIITIIIITTTTTSITTSVTVTTTRERSARGLVDEIYFFKKQGFRLSPKSCNLRHYVNIWSATCHNNTRKLHGSGGAEDTGDRTWDLLHQWAGPHQLSYTCNFPLVLFLFPLLASPCPTCQALWARPPYYRRKSLTTEGNPLL